MQAANQSIQTYGAVDESTVLTYRGGALGAIELSGVEPALLNPTEKTAITTLLRNVIQRLPFEVTFSQYYVHYRCPPYRLNIEITLVLNWCLQGEPSF